MDGLLTVFTENKKKFQKLANKRASGKFLGVFRTRNVSIKIRRKYAKMIKALISEIAYQALSSGITMDSLLSNNSKEITTIRPSLSAVISSS